MNLPNRLTIARLWLTVAFVAVMATHWRFANTCGLAIFLAATATDYLDGYLARRLNLITDFGKLMDSLADKILMSAAFILLVPEHGPLTGHGLPAWVPVVIIAREFAITGLRLLAASKGTVLAAERLGKHKTAWQMATVLFFLILLTLAELDLADVIGGLPWWDWVWKYVGRTMLGITLLLTAGSGVAYLWKYRRHIGSA